MQFDIPQERLDALLAEGWTITDDGYLEPPAPTRPLQTFSANLQTEQETLIKLGSKK